MKVMSLRWVIQSPADMLLNSKMFSIIFFSSAAISPFSSPRSTIMRISCSVTRSVHSAGRSRKNFATIRASSEARRNAGKNNPVSSQAGAERTSSVRSGARAAK